MSGPGQREFDDIPQGKPLGEQAPTHDPERSRTWDFEASNSTHGVDLGARGMETPGRKDYKAPKYYKKVSKEKPSAFLRTLPVIAAIAGLGLAAWFGYQSLTENDRIRASAQDLVYEYYELAVAGDTAKAATLTCRQEGTQAAYKQFQIALENGYTPDELFTVTDTTVFDALTPAKVGQFKKRKPTVVDDITAPAYKHWVVVSGDGYSPVGENVTSNWHVAVGDNGACLELNTLVVNDAKYLQQLQERGASTREMADNLTARVLRTAEEDGTDPGELLR